MAIEDYQLLQLRQDISSMRGELSRLKSSTGHVFVTAVIQDTSAATAANYGVFFVAPYACEIVEAWETHKVLGTDGSPVTLTVEKLTGGQALDAGVAVLTGTWSLKGTINDPNRLRASTNRSSRGLNPGDRLALKDSGTLTAVAHVCVTVLLRVSNYNVSRVDNP